MSGKNCKIYTSYNLKSLPKHPGDNWTRFVCMSDTHSQTNITVPPGNVLIHAGDLSSWGSLENLMPTLEWLKSLPFELKMIIAGNHDLCLDTKWKDIGANWMHPKVRIEVDTALEYIRSEDMRESGIIYLDHEETEIMTSKGVKWKIYGSPAAPFHLQGAFQYDSTEQAKDEWRRIPDSVEILVTHTPAYGILDKTRKGKYAGCSVLASRIKELLHCRMHVFGHIHEAHGAILTNRTNNTGMWHTQYPEVISVNPAMHHKSLPVIVDLKKDA
ncbi:uncharacterized protein FOMMEDRAFT_79003 [Fomitiporia mediterranea MF3/22]|uniref:uncharacterized protein n=1 Tax=Fomitiporia mediterranea (strain MF3/22) TaxID=694068 RepID=UPI0004408F45|nr:uncharacterized protein FOMMEDRAFT_79003 [Fomitiporia mediterranea MF3/22]EJD05717.1 hypothetical protein FOMMEDRAFT_79003 [Fomitiporia mediterranea MF3/22]